MATSNDLNINQSGYVVFDGTATFTGRTFQQGTGISLTNASGVAGNTTIGVDGSVVGQTITGDTGVISPTAGNWNIQGGAALSAGTNASVTSGSGSTLTVTSINCAKWIVDATANRGTHTTIQGAIDAASSGQTIFVRPGTYTENLTLKAGVDIVAFLGDSDIPNVTIVGKASYSSAGRTNISNIRLTTNGDYFLEVTGSAASVVNLNNCYLNCSNFTGINFTSSSSSAEINIFDCSGDLGTTGIALFTSSSAGIIFYNYSNFGNTGGSTTASTASAGTVVLRYSYFPNPITTSGTGSISVGFSVIAPAQNIKCLTLGGSNASTVTQSSISSGTAVAISVNANTLTLTNSVLNSTNTNVIDGAGTLVYAGLVFSNTSSNIATTTQTVRSEGPSRTIGSTNSGNTNTLTITNGSNTASSQALVQTTVAGGTAGDPYHVFTVTGGNSGSIGVDNSDSDVFKLSYATTLGSNDTVLVDATGGRYKGYGTNTTPAAGFIGELKSAQVLLGSAVALTTATGANITNITLTAGIWDVSGTVNFTGAPTGTSYSGSISQTSATLSNPIMTTPTSPTAVSTNGVALTPFRIEVNTNTTVYLVAQATFTAGSVSAYGRISATRVA